MSADKFKNTTIAKAMDEVARKLDEQISLAFAKPKWVPMFAYKWFLKKYVKIEKKPYQY